VTAAKRHNRAASLPFLVIALTTMLNSRCMTTVQSFPSNVRAKTIQGYRSVRTQGVSKGADLRIFGNIFNFHKV
jgi:hypothetical protein